MKVSLQFPTKRTRHHGFQAAGARNHGFLTKTEASDPLKNYTVVVKLCRFPCNFPTKPTRDQGFEATGKQQGLAGSRSLFSVQNAPLKTGKQHGLAGSRDPFWNHISPSPGGKRCVWILYKKLYGFGQALKVSLQWSGFEGFPAISYKTHSTPWFSSRRRQKPWFSHKNRGFRSTKKLYGCVKLCRFPCNFPTKRTRDQGFEATGKQQGLADEAYFPYKTHPSKQGNSMAWPVQGTHFGTTFPPAPGANVASGSSKKLYTVLVRL